MVNGKVAELAEHVPVVVILVCAEQGVETFTYAKGAGNHYARESIARRYAKALERDELGLTRDELDSRDI